MYFNIDSIVIVSFLILILVVGLYHGRDVKTIEQYALGGRKFSTGTLVSTIVATWIGGDYLFITLSEVYTTGLYYAIACCGMAISLFLTGVIFVPKMKEFLGQVSVAEAMGNLYGTQIRIITALSGEISAAGFIAVQFKVFAEIFRLYIGIPSEFALLVSASIVIIYSAFGGIKSITFTDVIQFFTFGVLIPVLGIIIWNDMHNIADFNLIQSVSNTPIFNYKEYLDLSKSSFWSLIFLLFLFSIPDFNPAVFQRIVMGRDIEQVQRAFSISSALVLVILIGMSWIGFLLFNINPNIDTNNLVHYIANNYAYAGLKSFICLGVIAMCMSSADSNINASSVLLTHDLCYPLGIKMKSELDLSKIIAIILGICSILFALSKKNMLEIVFLAQSFYLPIVTVPLMLAILGFRSTKKSVLIGMVAGITSVIIWRIFFMHTDVDSIIPGMLANFLFFICSHYLLKQEGGWKTNNQTPKNTTIVKALRPLLIYSFFSKFNFLAFCKKNAPKNELMYTGFGIFSTISTICTMYSVSNAVGIQNDIDLLLYYEIMLIISISFLTYPIWPSSIKKDIIIQVFWNIAIFYLLIFCSSFFVMLTKFSPLQFVVFTTNIITVAILTRWKIAISMFVIGFICSIQYYKYYVNVDTININITSTAFFLYSLLLTGTTVIIFLKPKQEYLETTERKIDSLETEVTHLDHKITGITGQVTNLNKQVSHYSERVLDQKKEIERLGATAQKILNNVNHEMRIPIGSVINFSDMLHESLMKSNDTHLQKLSDEVVTNSTRLSSMILNMLDLALLDIKKIELEKTIINFSELVKERVKSCRAVYLQNKLINFKLIIDPEIMISIDPNYMRQVVDNIIINAISFSDSGLSSVTVKKEKHTVRLTITDQGKGIPFKDLADIFEPFNVGSNVESKAQGRGVGLALCKTAVEAHGGFIKAYSEGTGAVFKVVIPLVV
jgi:Na+/proline symporter/signal transduction histidine kinase